MTKFLLFLVILCTSKFSTAQKLFTVSIESGIIQPFPIFYKGIDASSNEDPNVTADLGFTALINCKWYYDRKSYLVLGIFYEAYSVNIKEFVRVPIDITPGGIPTFNRSYFYSNFDAKNVGFRISFGNTLNQVCKLSTGFQLGFPLNKHHGFFYLGTHDKITDSYNYTTQNPFSLFANIEYQCYKTKKLEFILVPEIGYNLQKDAKTYILENQIRKMYLALRVGIGLK